MARSGAKPWRKPEPEPEPEPKPEPDPEPKREPERPEPKYRRQGWRAHCACAVRAASAPCVRTVCVRRQLASQPRAAPHNPAQLLTTPRSSSPPSQPVAAPCPPCRRSPSSCATSPPSAATRTGTCSSRRPPQAACLALSPSLSATRTRTPNQVPSFGQVRLDIAHGRMSQGVSSMRPVASQSVGSRSVSSL